ncbi:MAG: DUF3445 domain-containing protein [Roseibium sp.]|uniref:heme-dependent oxidative N-demethylase family protein n=1 Tax=Roseibium sp. TaxID=1936156 RepID=UPI003D9C2495
MPMPPEPPFQHRPYDGSTRPFTVGLKPIGEETWLEPDQFLDAHLAEKERLFAQDLRAVFRAEEDTCAAQREVLDLVTDNLMRFHPLTHRVEAGSATVIGTGRRIAFGQEPALLTASKLVQEDLVIMREGPDGYRLVAASVCFPSSWRLSEKIGRSMSGIHEGVPDFNGARMGQVVGRLFENLATDQLVCRFNWSIYPDDNLHHPIPEGIAFAVTEESLARLFLRVERQTLRRLPKSGDIVFTIRIHHDPLAKLAEQEDRKRIASDLRSQLMDLTADQLDYKGMIRARDEIAETLERM